MRCRQIDRSSMDKHPKLWKAVTASPWGIIRLILTVSPDVDIQTILYSHELELEREVLGHLLRIRFR